MMNISRFRFDAAAGLLLAATLVACGGQDPAPAAPAPAPVEPAPAEPVATEPAPAPAPTGSVLTAEDEALAERAIAYFQALADAAAAAGSDCDQMAANIQGVAAQQDVQALWSDMERLDGDEAKSQALEQKYSARLEATIGPMMQTLMACQENEAVQQALETAIPQG